MQWPLLWDLLQRLRVRGKVLGAVQSLYDNDMLSMSFNGEGRTLSKRLRHGCPLTATILGMFNGCLHHYLKAVAPAAGGQIQHMRLRLLVYAHDMRLMASLARAIADPH